MTKQRVQLGQMLPRTLEQTAGHGHKLMPPHHEPAVWHYKDGCTLTKNADGSFTMKPAAESPVAPESAAAALSVLDEAVKR